jgi:hypothetical protein
MTDIQSKPHHPQTFNHPLSSELLNKLQAALSPEEYEQVTAAIEENTTEIYNQKFWEFDAKFSNLHGVEITTNQAFEKYGVHPNTVGRWYKNRWVRRINAGRGQGIQSTFDEGDIVVLFETNKFRLGDGKKLGRAKGGWTPPERS